MFTFIYEDFYHVNQNLLFPARFVFIRIRNQRETARSGHHVDSPLSSYTVQGFLKCILTKETFILILNEEALGNISVDI